jgi:hypothetical protein
MAFAAFGSKLGSLKADITETMPRQTYGPTTARVENVILNESVS